jgi:hypothetical protein
MASDRNSKKDMAAPPEKHFYNICTAAKKVHNIR